MKKFIPLLLLSLFTHSALAEETYGAIKGCGRYKVAGIIRKNKEHGIHLVVNEKTASEYQFKPASGELPKFVGFIDLPIKLETSVTKLDGTKGEVASPSGIKPIVPDPLHPNLNSGFILIEQKKCEK